MDDVPTFTCSPKKTKKHMKYTEYIQLSLFTQTNLLAWTKCKECMFHPFSLKGFNCDVFLHDSHASV